MNDRTICRIDDDQLIEVIKKAARRLVFAAPGVSLAVAQALGGAWRRLNGAAVSVILDVDPAVCRLGYGTLEGLQELQKTADELGEVLCHQPGLRVGIVVSDQTTLVYTPTPLLIEPGAEKPARSNGIVLSSPPESLAGELGIGSAAQAGRQIGLDKVPDDQVKALERDLKVNPPLRFDISRPVLVFNSQVEFVEFNLEKIQLQRQEVPIPPNLMGLTTKNIHGLFRLEVGKELLVQKEELEQKKRKIDKQFTRPMRGFSGSIIQRSQKEKFHMAVEELEAELESFRQSVRRQFRAIAETNKTKLVDDLLPAVKHNPPEECPRELTRPGAEGRLRNWLLNQLSGSFDKVSKVADDMRVTVHFKGVTYECLTNPEFTARARHAFPELQLHEEFSAARQKPVGGR